MNSLPDKEKKPREKGVKRKDVATSTSGCLPRHRSQREDENVVALSVGFAVRWKAMPSVLW